ncbi:MAG: DNA polymerase Y family protein [Thalassobaculaceae bacterium]|nr:DNA polymerase Y family protein [Thalassobaculaceae bacterium]
MTTQREYPAFRAERGRRVIALWLPHFAVERHHTQERCDADAVQAVATRERGRRVIAGLAPGVAGLTPGMALADARALTPDLTLADWDPAADRAALRDLAAWCVRYTPLIAFDPASACLRDGIGGDAALWLDVTGASHLFGGDWEMVADLVNRIASFGYTARACMADTPGIAWAVTRTAATGRGDVVVPSGAGIAAIARLPIMALRVPAAVAEALARSGLRRIGDVADLPRAPLAARFGPDLARRLDQAAGSLHEPIEPLSPPAPHRVRLGLPEPIGLREDIEHGVRRLLERLCARLERERAGLRRLRVDFFRAEGDVRSLTIGTGRPARDPVALFRLLAEHLDRLDPGFGIDVMVMEAERVEGRGIAQKDLAGPTAGAMGEGVQDMVDRLSNRLGEERVHRLEPVESHLPERAERPSAPATASRWPTAPAPSVPRPARLLRRPEPVEATALLPDHPPAWFRWRGVDYRIARAAGPERIAPEWWEDLPADRRRGGRTRDYFRLEARDGQRFWLYREGLAERGEAPQWFVHGLFA